MNSGEEHERMFTLGKRKGEKEKKASKKMKGPCDDKCRMDCKEIFTEEVRKKIFTACWKLTNIQEKRYYICARVHKVTKARCRKRTYDTEVRRRSRNNSYEYTFVDPENETYDIRVCQDIFLNTMSISKTTVKTAFSKRTDWKY